MIFAKDFYKFKKNVAKDMLPRKQPQDNGTSNMEGKNHQIECDCGIWTDIWVPTRIPRNFRDKKFLCGFCAQEKIEKVEEKNRKVRRKAQSTHPQSRTYKNCTSQLRKHCSEGYG